MTTTKGLEGVVASSTSISSIIDDQLLMLDLILMI